MRNSVPSQCQVDELERLICVRANICRVVPSDCLNTGLPIVAFFTLQSFRKGHCILSSKLTLIIMKENHCSNMDATDHTYQVQKEIC